MCQILKTRIILPLFEGKGAITGNYGGITLFPTIFKIYEMIIVNRLEKFASQFFFQMQFGFQKGVRCVEASFTILETITSLLALERGSKIFGCFLDVCKASDTVWTDGLLFKLLTELGTEGRMWLAIKDLYTAVKAQGIYSGYLSRSFDVSQGTGQGQSNKTQFER